MNNCFKIWIDRLKNGQTQIINESASPEFLDVNEEELILNSPVSIKGSAYIADHELIIKITASTQALMPCAICNQMTPVELSIKEFYHAQPIEEIPSGIYDYSLPLREALLIEIPRCIECNKGKCPDRKVIAPFLRSEKTDGENTHFPFSNLDS